MLRQTSSGSVKIISINRDELLAALGAIAKQICAQHPEVKSVRVFGSIARGDPIGTSDVDVMIVLHGGEQDDLWERTRLFYPYFDLPIGVDLLVYAEDQVARRLRAGETFMTQIWQESRVLCQ